MQVELEREKVLKPLTMVAGVVERRQTLPILSYMLLRTDGDGVSLTGTDLELEMVCRVPGGVEKAGEVTVPARKLFDICRALPEGSKITLSRQGERVVVKSGRSRFTLSSLPVADFPKVETGSFKEAVVLPASRLKRILERTAFCMAQQDVRYYLNGLYLENEGTRLRAVATDGHRMAIADTECEGAAGETLQVIVPRKAVLEISRLVGETSDPIRLEISANHIRLTLAEATFTSKLIDGKFPDYTRVIPLQQSKQVPLDRQAFREAMGRVAILANEKYRGIRLNLETGKLLLSAHNPEQEEAVEEVETSYQGEGLEIGFNVTYLLEAAGAIDGNEVVLGLNDPNSSCTLRAPGQADAQYIIMPMRL
ncbi:MAG TPA: DNA polymerase III subunit beta [Burkholderiales bacterium]